MGTILTVLLAGIMVVVLPYAPRFAAGAMLYALCGSGGIDPRDVSRKALQQCGNHSVCRRIYPHDDTGCGTGGLSE